MLKAYSVDTLRTGMKVGRDVLDLDGRVILKKNTKLDNDKIQSLLGQNVFSVYIDEEEMDDTSEIAGQDHLLDSAYIESYKKTYNIIQNIYYTMGNGGQLNMGDLEAVVTPSNIVELCDGATAITQIHNMTRDGDYVIHHAVNVGILSGLMAHWVNYPQAETLDLVMSGMLSEIGKMKVPKEILNKTGKLEPEELDKVKRHVDYGYDMLKVSPVKDKPNVLMGVLQHHERCDGSGYPNRTKGDQLGDFGKIIAILDIYDAMAANRSYAKRKSPFDIIKILYEDVLNGKLDTRFGILFMKKLSHSLNGNWVGLSDGQRAKIVYVDESRVTSMPIVQTTKNEFIDLSKRSDIKIESILTANEV